LRITSALLKLPGLQVLPIPANAVAGWMGLLKRRPMIGCNVFDLQIVATMLANDIHRIYTYKVDDFAVFLELVVVKP